MGLNGGPKYKFSPANSYVIECETQAEIDHYWNKLGQGGVYNQCGWLDDKFGVSWQVVPRILHELMADNEKSPRVVQAFMQMQKFDLETLLNA
jgi:predicted 3-demethylubiquinone-9 3-methyltransferase (glyoxalase superfamily)